MPKHIAIGTHAPSQCPGANKQIGDVFQKIMSAAPAIAQKHNVRLGEVTHMGPSHKLMFAFEAANADTLLAYLYESRLDEVQDIERFFAEELHSFMQKSHDLNLQPLF